MTNSITKADIIWLIVRTTGFVLVVLAILRIPPLVGVIAWTWGLGEETLRSAAVSKALTGDLLSVLLHGGIGLYLLRKGDWAYSLLDRAAAARPNTAVERDASPQSGSHPSP